MQRGEREGGGCHPLFAEARKKEKKRKEKKRKKGGKKKEKKKPGNPACRCDKRTPRHQRTRHLFFFFFFFFFFFCRDRFFSLSPRIERNSTMAQISTYVPTYRAYVCRISTWLPRIRPLGPSTCAPRHRGIDSGCQARSTRPGGARGWGRSPPERVGGRIGDMYLHTQRAARFPLSLAQG